MTPPVWTMLKNCTFGPAYKLKYKYKYKPNWTHCTEQHKCKYRSQVNEYPWMVALAWKVSNIPFCGGTLVCTGFLFYRFPQIQYTYSVPFEVVAFLEELFSPPWLSLEPPRLHQILTLVSRVPHKNFSALRPKKWAFETEQPSPPLRAPEVGALLKPFRAQQDFSTWFLSIISLWNTIHISVFCLKS